MKTVQIFVAGSTSSFKCVCTCNVFTRISDPAYGKVYRCNSCGQEYEGVDKAAERPSELTESSDKEKLIEEIARLNSQILELKAAMRVFGKDLLRIAGE